MSERLKHRKCGFCQGSVPVDYTECPYCEKSLEPYGLIQQVLAQLLPKDRPMTRVLAGFAIALYALMGLVAGGTALIAPSTYTLIHFGAMFPPYIAEGQWWRLVTALFLHGDLTHIGFNLWALWTLGPLIENSFGKARYLLAFLVTGVVSTLVSLLWSSIALGFAESVTIPMLFTPETVSTFTTPSVGMSGALTGLIGVGIAAGHKVSTPMGLEVRNQLMKWMGFIVVFGLLVPGIDNAAHFGGFFAGLAIGYLLPLRGRAKRAGGFFFDALAVVCAVVIVGSVVLQGVGMPRQYPADLKRYPTAIFGSIVRSANLEDPVFIATQKACREASRKIEGLSAAAPAQVERATLNCEELKYFEPMNPYNYIATAQAALLRGGQGEACRDLEIAGRIVTNGLRGVPKPLKAQEMVRINQSLDALKCR